MPRGSGAPFVVRGGSMRPSLRDLDRLLLAPPAGGSYRIGDVIAFRDGSMGRLVAHRIVARGAAGYVTRGDARTRNDPAAVDGGAVLGRVVAVARRDRVIGVPGGILGRLVGGAARVRLGLLRATRRLGEPVARVAWGTPLARATRRLLPRTTVVAIRREDGTAYRLMMGDRCIGHRDPGRGGAWRIRMPYRLFLDPSEPTP